VNSGKLMLWQGNGDLRLGHTNIIPLGAPAKCAILATTLFNELETLPACEGPARARVVVGGLSAIRTPKVLGLMPLPTD
jgi:hypothetical protein